jgi:plasmid stabilization system protein ParE
VAVRGADAILGVADRLATLPVIYRPAARAGLREYVMDRFPFILLYRVSPRKVQVVAITHKRQER